MTTMKTSAMTIKPAAGGARALQVVAPMRTAVTAPFLGSAALLRPQRKLVPHAKIRQCRRGAVAAYEPSPMDASLLVPQLAVLATVGIAGAYWWFVLVPSARVRLAVNKKSGTLRKYLEDLKDDDSRPLEKWFYTNWLTKVDPETKYLLREEGSEGSEASSSDSPYSATALSETGGVQEGSDGEDSLEEVIRKAKKTPKFWSADNPVLVGAALSILGAAAFGGISGN